MYDVHRLRLLRELSHRGTLAAVAEALGYRPSSVSHQLATLEREVGARLLEPAGRGVRLTAIARVLVAHTEAILRELEEAQAAVAAADSELLGAVRLATFQTAAHRLLPGVLTRLAAQHPRLGLTVAHVRAEQALPALLARDVDVVLSERYRGQVPPLPPGVVRAVSAPDAMLLATPASWGRVSLRDLAHAPWALEPEGTAARAWATALCRAAGFEPRVIVESTDVYLHERLVADGLAAAFLPRLAGLACPRAETGGVASAPTGEHRIIDVYLRSGSQSAPAIAAVRDALAEALSALSG